MTAWNVMSATCPSRTALAEVSNKWAQLIVLALRDGPLRFKELRLAVEGITPKVLSETLQRMHRDGFLTRTALDQMPPRVDYALTPLGLSLLGPIDAMRSWAENNVEHVLANRAQFDSNTQVLVKQS